MPSPISKRVILPVIRLARTPAEPEKARNET
jgi:hypothetical protein